MKRQAKQIDYQSLSASDLVWLAQVDNDQQAINEIYARKTVIAVRIARNYCRRYTFVDVDDLSQSLLMGLPKIIRTYRPGKATDWDKYCYHRLFYSAKDVLRQRDDLGIMWPQRRHTRSFIVWVTSRWKTTNPKIIAILIPMRSTWNGFTNMSKHGEQHSKSQPSHSPKSERSPSKTNHCLSPG